MPKDRTTNSPDGRSDRREPLAAKVPEIIALFWVVKLLTTFTGEAASDFLGNVNVVLGGGIEVIVLAVAAWLQLRTRRYYAPAYWLLAAAIATTGTGASDTLHVAIGIPYAGTTALWALVLVGVFWRWHRSEGTLSIHSITTRRRELYYWATVFATFALGTALGDLTATSMNLGYLLSAALFGAVILVPLVGWWRFRMNEVMAFWFAYILTRPLGATFADYFGRAARGQRPRVRLRTGGCGRHRPARASRRLRHRLPQRHSGLPNRDPAARSAFTSSRDAAGDGWRSSPVKPGHT